MSKLSQSVKLFACLGSLFGSAVQGADAVKGGDITYTPRQSTSAELWADYVKNPDTNTNIPNCSYAGYQCGEKALPEPKVVANVKDFGAKADDQADDTEAFKKAVAAAKQAGGGAILVPAGTYRLTGMILLDGDNLVLRGEGIGKTILRFEKHLNEVLVSPVFGKLNNMFPWSGGLVWIAPPGMINPDGRTFRPAPAGIWYDEWHSTNAIGRLSVPAKRGDSSITVEPAAAAKLQPGMMVLFSWSPKPEDTSLYASIAGHESMKDYTWGKWRGKLRWPVEIVEVKDNMVRLRQPLRVDIRPEWGCQIMELGPSVRESGVERMSLKMPQHPVQPHIKDLGFNGVAFTKAVHCWTRDVEIENADNGVIMSSCKNCTASGFVLRGQEHHHGALVRMSSHDNLFTDFRIESKPLHGLNTEWVSAGNVWRRGFMEHGTFDSHRAMSFDLIRTCITLRNDGIPGGAEVGPFNGARVVHWNIRAIDAKDYRKEYPGIPAQNCREGAWIYQPDLHSDAALVGIQEVKMSLRNAVTDWNTLYMTVGDKNCIVADHGKVPEPPDLYQAQLELRLSRQGMAAARQAQTP